MELTETGRNQALKLAALIKNTEFDAIYSSPLTRAKTTAETASGRQVQTDQRLTELDFGAWEGKTRSAFIKEDPGLWESWNENPEVNRAGGNGESGGELVKRLDDFMDEILKKHETGTILIVAHNGVNRFLIASLLGMPLRNYRKIVQENSSLTVLGYDKEEGFSLMKLNCRG